MRLLQRFVVLPCVCGVAIAIAVSWGLASTLDFSWTDRVKSSWYHADSRLDNGVVGTWTVHMERRTGGVIITSSRYRDPFSTPEVSAISPYRAVPHWTGLHAKPSSEVEVDIVCGWGWPRLALANKWNDDCGYYWRGIPTSLPALTFGVFQGQMPRSLPLKPIWPGLLTNAAIYATVHIFVIGLCRAFVRHHRVSRGKCVHCGHLLDPFIMVSGCPECGPRGSG